MVSGKVRAAWAMLPGLNWGTALDARTWLIEKRRLLGWSHRDVAKAFFKCAVQSDLFIGPGGGALFDRATEKRIARFERDGDYIPDWAYWLPLVFQHAQVPVEDRQRWERQNIPEHTGLRIEKLEEERHFSTFHLNDTEIALITRVRGMDAEERDFLRFVIHPKMLRWGIDVVKRAERSGATLIDIVENALSQPDCGRP